MNRRQKIIVSVTGIFLVLLILVGLTYAFFVTRIRGNNNPTSISVTTANLVVEYGDGNGMLKAINHIEPGDPIEFAEVDENGDFILGQDGKPIKHTTKTFTVENKGNDTATYSLVLTDITNTLERNQDLEFTLTKNGTVVTEGLDLNHIAAGDHQILLPKVTIAKDAIDTYTLAITYKEAGIDQSEDMNSTIEFKIDIENEKTTWNNASEGTLTYALKNASDVSTTIGNTEDDYGTSYYYKGAVTNNYVNYSGKCWRIVRVQGDGTIKLVLADRDNLCNSNDYDVNDGTSSYVVIESWEENDILIEDFGSTYYYSQDVFSGFVTYGGSNLEEQVNSWVSNIDQKLLSTTSWCNDTSIFTYGVCYGSNEDGSIWTDDCNRKEDFVNKEGYYWYEYPDYGFKERLANSSYTLKCNMKGIEDTKASRIPLSSAVLTADELLLGGEYLNVNAKGWDRELVVNDDSGSSLITPWTMTPINMKSDTFIYTIYTTSIEEAQVVGPQGTVRPAIVIKSDVTLDKTVTGQNGTYTNPYEIG